MAQGRRPNFSGTLAAAACIGVVVLSSSLARRQFSVTLDETFYFANAIEMALDRRLPAMLATSGVAPLPVVVSYLLPALRAGDLGRTSPWIGLTIDPLYVDEARLIHCAVVAIPLVLMVFCWLTVRRGVACGAAGGLLLGLSPTLAAHGSIATTDCMTALACLLSIAAFARHWRQPSAVSLLLAAAAWAIAISTKYSALFLGPMAIAAAMRVPAQYVASKSLRLVQAAAFFAIVAVAAWGLHGFQWAPTPWGRMPAFASGILEQWRHQRDGHEAFLMGEKSKTGWWYFFPLAFLFKSTPIELALASICLARAVHSVLLFWRRGPQTGIDAAAGHWLVAGALYWLSALTSSVQIGQRFLLPIYPLAVLLAVDWIWSVTTNHRRRALAIGTLCVAGQGASYWAIAPHFLAYFNDACGGPGNGHRLLVDSSIDWGQDLPALRAELNALGARNVLLRYFGTALPIAYQIDAVRLNSHVGSNAEQCRWVAVSATELHGVYHAADPFRDLRRLEADARAGYSIFLYDQQKPAVAAAIRQAIKDIAAGQQGRNRPAQVDDYLQ